MQPLFLIKPARKITGPQPNTRKAIIGISMMAFRASQMADRSDKTIQ
jgi:hypothetical protein